MRYRCTPTTLSCNPAHNFTNRSPPRRLDADTGAGGRGELRLDFPRCLFHDPLRRPGPARPSVALVCSGIFHSRDFIGNHRRRRCDGRTKRESYFVHPFFILRLAPTQSCNLGCTCLPTSLRSSRPTFWVIAVEKIWFISRNGVQVTILYLTFVIYAQNYE